MATITHEFDVCEDCALAHSNGEVSEDCLIDPLSALIGYDIALDEQTDDYAHFYCDGHNGWVAGSRYRMVAFDYVEGKDGDHS